MKTRKWISKWYMYVSMGVIVNLAIVSIWVPHLESGAEGHDLRSSNPNIVIVEPPKITEDTKLVFVGLDDGSEFSITIKEARALRRAVRALLAERIADLESELFIAKGGINVRPIGPRSSRQLRLLEALVAELQELQSVLSAQGAK